MNTRKLVLTLLSLLTLVAACGGASTPASAAPAAEPVAGLSEEYDDALSVRNQLTYGTLRLEGTANAVTADQAAKLLPLWQALQALDASSTTATEETAAVQAQIVSTMTPAQVSAIAAMRLTNAALQAYYDEIGVTEVRTPEPGVTPQSSSMRSLPQEQREAAKATAQALGTPVGSGSGGGGDKRDALMDAVLALLSVRVATGFGRELLFIAYQEPVQLCTRAANTGGPGVQELDPLTG